MRGTSGTTDQGSHIKIDLWVWWPPDSWSMTHRFYLDQKALPKYQGYSPVPLAFEGGLGHNTDEQLQPCIWERTSRGFLHTLCFLLFESAPSGFLIFIATKTSTTIAASG